ncbi:MAG: HigA family addiction module antitoxin [Rhodovibrio sp.]|nr:HigA family addiction module antitoxin [Rhodovibrio sp.]
MPQLPNIHPGEVLKAEFLEHLGLSGYRLAQELGIPHTRVHEILHARRSISPDTAARLARYFQTSEMFWLNLQANHDLLDLKRSKADEIARIKPNPAVLQAD